jgi:hypothetical protein
MTPYTGVTARHVNSYHQSNSLLFQFILLEFIEAYAEIHRLDGLRNRPLSSSSLDEITSLTEESPLHLIETALAKLAGSPKDHMRLFSWNFNEGLLSKLRAYCTLFLQNDDTNEKELIAVQHYVDKIWQACVQASEATHEFPQERPLLFAALDKASAAMQRLAKLITRLIYQFRDDENVIFYILRNHQILDQLYGQKFTLKLMSKLYPKGLKEAHLLLTRKYQQRGFDNLVTPIAATVKEIEASLHG